MNICSRTLKYGDDIDTDVIISARFLNTGVVEDYAVHCMEDLDKDFVKKLGESSLLIVGKNFGCGSSREHAPLSLKSMGVSCIIAKNFARIFYRNAINIGLPIVECEQAAEEIREGEEVEVDFVNGIVRNLSTGKEYQYKQFPKFVLDIINNNGLVGASMNGVF